MKIYSIVLLLTCFGVLLHANLSDSPSFTTADGRVHCETVTNTNGDSVSKCSCSQQNLHSDKLDLALLAKTYTLGHRLYDAIKFAEGDFGQELSPRVTDANALQNFLMKQYDSLEDEVFVDSCIIDKLGLRSRVYSLMVQAVGELEKAVSELEAYALKHVK